MNYLLKKTLPEMLELKKGARVPVGLVAQISLDLNGTLRRDVPLVNDVREAAPVTLIPSERPLKALSIPETLSNKTLRNSRTFQKTLISAPIPQDPLRNI